MGRFVEYILSPGIPTAFQLRGIPIHGTSQRVKRNLQQERIEVDILGVNEDCVLAVEAKSTLSVDDVKHFIEQLKKFKMFFPEYKDKKIYGAVAGIEIIDKADVFSYRQGLFVLGQSEESSGC
jgi:hypothetical protein